MDVSNNFIGALYRSHLFCIPVEGILCPDAKLFLDVIHCQQRSPLLGSEGQPALSQMRVEGVESEVCVGMSPAEECVKDFDIHSAWFFKKETAAWLEHTDDLIDRFPPIRDVMQYAEDDDHIFAGIGKLT